MTRTPTPEVEYKPTQLVIPAEMTIDEYVALLRSLGAIVHGHQWWGGDALVEGERRYGDDFAQYADELGVEPHTLTNWRWVADSVKPSRRREDLSWSHHAEVARLDPKAQKAALAHAAKEGLNVRQLRDYVALTWPQARQEHLDLGPLNPREEIDVNKRLEQIERTLEAGDDVDAADVRWLVDLAKRLVRSAR